MNREILHTPAGAIDIGELRRLDNYANRYTALGMLAFATGVASLIEGAYVGTNNSILTIVFSVDMTASILAGGVFMTKSEALKEKVLKGARRLNLPFKLHSPISRSQIYFPNV